MKIPFTATAIFLIAGCTARVEIDEQEARRTVTEDVLVETTVTSRHALQIGSVSTEADPPKPIIGSERNAPANSFLTRSGENQILVGKWRIVKGDQDGTVEFTPGGHVMFVWAHRGLGRNWIETGTYSWANPTRLHITEAGDYGGESERGIEFLTDDELLVTNPTGTGFPWLYGKLERVNQQ